MPTIVRIGPDIAFSLMRFFKTVQYTVGVDTKALQGHFAHLRLLPAYPDDLTALTTPALAFSAGEEMTAGEDFFGEEVVQSLYPFSIHGFVVGRGSDQASKLYRDRLKNDVEQLLRVVASSEGIPLYDHASGNALAGETLEVVNVRSRLIPANAPMIEADRYKFVVEGAVDHTTSRLEE